jgi:anti-sigma factor (TIGR02949 family)
MATEEPNKKSHKHSCQGVVDLLCDLLEGDLPCEEEKELEGHMADCPPCVAFMNTYRKTTDVCKSLRAEDIPPELRERLERFIAAGKYRGE